MNTPRLEINLDKICHNASVLVARLKTSGITVTGVTKGFLGAPQIVRTMLQGGVASLGDSRIENIEFMKRSGIDAQMILIRSPMISQADRVVASADISFNTEIEVLHALSIAAVKARKIHGVLLMVELGDLREGIMPPDVNGIIFKLRELPNISFMGLGANLACRSGVSPDSRNMAKLSALADQFDPSDGKNVLVVSGGNSANLDWISEGGNLGRINNLRLGEAILLGRETLNRNPIPGLFTDAISLIAEVIESKTKPAKPWGTLAQSAFNDVAGSTTNGNINQAIIAIGRQDIDPDGLQPGADLRVLSASSDHLVVKTGDKKLAVGSNVSFQLNYSAFLRAMTSPHVARIFSGNDVKRLQFQNCKHGTAQLESHQLAQVDNRRSFMRPANPTRSNQKDIHK